MAGHLSRPGARRLYPLRARQVVVGPAHTQIRPDQTAILWRLYVAQAYRSQGIGEALITASVQRLPPAILRLYVKYYQTNTRAAAFYARLGFIVERTETLDFRGTPVVSVFTHRSLNPMVGVPHG